MRSGARPFSVSRSLHALVAVAGLVCTLAAARVLPAAAFETDAEYAVLMDAATGAVLFEKRAHEPMAPASMSKLMTAYMMFEKLKDGTFELDDTFHVSEKAWRMGGSKMFTRVDTDIPIHDLLRGIIVQSGNDACVVVAEGLAGTEEAFAEAMTRRAREIGLKNSTFANSTGWPDPRQRMSAYDLAKLSQIIVTEFPDYFPIYAERDFTWSDIRQENRNPLLGVYQGADGMKTGHTEESGYGLVGTAVRRVPLTGNEGTVERRLIVVVNGLDSDGARAAEARKLLDHGFRDFRAYALFLGGQIIQDNPVEVWGGSMSRLPVSVREDITMFLTNEEREGMEVKLAYEGPVQAPIAYNDEVGALIVSVPGREPVRYPVFAAVAVEKAGFTKRVLDGLMHVVDTRLLN
ncbi:MAG: D-alanyl-D-alanine carboxypeptidase [Alphaproteobacteria bacterium]|nr:D-alanyl-D-alanine carboxypeptidase [Alphaproteobacteria bacterium]